VVAIWEYDDLDAYRRIQAGVAADPDMAVAWSERTRLGELFTAKDETFMTSTVTSPPGVPSHG